MKKEDVLNLAKSQALPGGPASMLETHLSWVLLNDEFAFKIKKPIRLSFVDYHLRAQRRYYCERELLLNRRYAPAVYLDVLPLGYRGGEWAVGNELDEVVDYGLQMKRLDNDQQMDNLLKSNKLTESDVRRVAERLAKFHRRAEKIGAPLDPTRMLKDFGDISQVSTELTALLGAEAVEWMLACQEALMPLLESWRPRLQKRAARGWRVDGHGDLHAGNVFVYPREVLFFDAIEFNDSWRQVDVLDEVAFLSVDLDYYGRTDLQQALWQAYQQAYTTCMTTVDLQLFNFFLCYRASVRLKVAALLWRQIIVGEETTAVSVVSAAAHAGSAGQEIPKTKPTTEAQSSRVDQLADARGKVTRYFHLMQAYWERLPAENGSAVQPQGKA